MNTSLQEVASHAGQVRPDERRAHERVAGRIVIRIGTRKAVNKGLVHNLSLGGLGVYTRCVYPPGTTVAIAVESESAPELALTGEIRWTRIVSGNPPDAVYEMGVRLVEPPPQYMRLFASFASGAGHPRPADSGTVSTDGELGRLQADSLSSACDDPAPQRVERRADPRLESAVPVTFVEPSDVAGTLTRNIAGGGAFIVGAGSLSVGMVAVVEVRLPEIPEPVRALGRVAHVRPSTGPGDPGGVGLRFLRFYAGSEDRLRTYLDGLRQTLGVEEVSVLRAVDLQGS